MQRIRWSQERSAGGEEGELCAGFELAELAEFDDFAGIGEFDDLNEFNAFDEFDERGSRRKGWEDGARRNAVSVVFLAQTKRAFDAEYAVVCLNHNAKREREWEIWKCTLHI